MKKRKPNQSTQRSRIPWKRGQTAKTLRPDTPISRLSDLEIGDYVADMQELVEYTNRRIDQLVNQGLTTVELYNFQQGDEYARFDISGITKVGDLRAYMAEVRTVLASIEGEHGMRKAMLDTAAIESEYYRGQFGNNYRDQGGFNMASVVDDNGQILRMGVDKNVAQEAFAAYRRLEETYAPLIGRQGQEGVFGSENLIIAIYDYYARGMDGQMYGRDLLEAWSDEYLMEMEGINAELMSTATMVDLWEDYLNRRAF